MSITLEEYKNTQSNYNIRNYNNVNFDNLVLLFGDYLTYNELNKYDSDNQYKINVATKLNGNKGIMTLWIDDNYVKNFEFTNCGAEVIYRLEQLDSM
jgi:hypothetical protein